MVDETRYSYLTNLLMLLYYSEKFIQHNNYHGNQQIKKSNYYLKNNEKVDLPPMVHDDGKIMGKMTKKDHHLF